MEYKFFKLAIIDDLRFFIDNPKEGQNVDAACTKISGWAHSDKTTELNFAVESKSVLYRVKINQARADVSRHLKEKVGIEVETDIHGFSVTIPYSDEFKLGFDFGNGPIWVHKVTAKKTNTFDNYDSIEQLTKSSEGVCGGVYFHNADDWSKVIILFNGALTDAKIAFERAPFQRWSWAKHFKHPVFCVVDPLTIGKDRLLLGWYLGSAGENSLPDTLIPITSQIRRVNPLAQTIGFGSSGGGFAAIGATLLGCTDHAIAINPQTDALQFNVKSAVEGFQRKRMSTPCQSNLANYDLSKMRANSSIIYVQNEYDEHHFTEHYLPFRKAVEAGNRGDAFKFVEYRDRKSGHMPPNFDELCKILKNDFMSLLKA